MKNILFSAITAIILSLGCIPSQAQKIAHIDLDTLIQFMPEYKTALNDVQEHYKKLETQLMTMENELRSAYQAYLEKETGYTELIKKTEQERLNDMQKRIEDFRIQAQQDYQVKQATLTKPLIDKAKKAIEQVAKESGYKYVLDTSGGTVLYSEPSDDILSLVKKKMNITGAPAAGGNTSKAENPGGPEKKEAPPKK